MKSSELKEMIKEIVSQELKKQLPNVLSELYIKKVVAESVDRNHGAVSHAKPSSLMETLDNRSYQRPEPSDSERQMVREKIRKHVLEDVEENPMAHLYEGLAPIDDENSSGEPDVDLSKLSFNRNAISAAVGSTRSTDRGPMPETPEMKQRKLDLARAKLDSMKVG